MGFYGELEFLVYPHVLYAGNRLAGRLEALSNLFHKPYVCVSQGKVNNNFAQGDHGGTKRYAVVMERVLTKD